MATLRPFDISRRITVSMDRAWRRSLEVILRSWLKVNRNDFAIDCVYKMLLKSLATD